MTFHTVIILFLVLPSVLIAEFALTLRALAFNYSARGRGRAQKGVAGPERDEFLLSVLEFHCTRFADDASVRRTC